MSFRKCKGFEILFHTFHLASGAKWKADNKIIGWPGTTVARVLKVRDSQLAFALTKHNLLSPSPLLVSEVQHFTYQEMSDTAIVVRFLWLIALLCEQLAACKLCESYRCTSCSLRLHIQSEATTCSVVGAEHVRSCCCSVLTEQHESICNTVKYS